MKFTPLEDFKHGYATFEAGNTYDSEKHGLADADVEGFYGLGWAKVEGRDAPPPRQPGVQSIQPHKATHAAGDTNG